MKAKTLLILAGLLLLSLACTLEDLSAVGTELRTTALDAASPTATTGLPTPDSVPAVVREEATAVPAIMQTVCTGVPEGTLRVREKPGTSAAVVAYLREDVPVTVVQEETTQGSTWAEITDPAGWVNARYLCASEK